MKFKIKFAEQITGLFILLAIGFLGFLVILMGINQRWFKTNYYFVTEFDSAKGLSVGMPVKMKGLQIGSVDGFEMKIEETYKIYMYFHIYGEEIEKIKAYSIIKLVSNPLDLGSSLNVFTNESMIQTMRLMPENSSLGAKANPIFFPSDQTQQGLELIENNLVNMGSEEDLINDTITRVQSAIAKIESVSKTLDDTLKGKTTGPLSEILDRLNLAIYSLQTSLEKISDTISAIKSAAGNLNSMVSNVNSGLPATMSNIHSITEDLKTTMSAVAEPGGFVKQFLNPKGSLARLLNDDNALFDRITSVMDSVVVVIDKVSENIDGLIDDVSTLLASFSEGGTMNTKAAEVIDGIKTGISDTIGLVNGEVSSVSEKLRSILSNLDNLSQELKDPEGLVPKLLADNGGAYDKLTDTMAGIGRLTDNLSGKLLQITDNINTISGSVKTTLDSLETSVAGIEQIIDNVNSLTSSMRSAQGLAPKLLDPKGSIATLLNDDNKLFLSIMEIVDSLKETVAKLKEFSIYINSTSPQITGILEEGQDTLDKGKDVLEGLSNNPLIKGGITKEKEQQTTFQSFRDEDF